MKIEYDPEVDALYISFKQGPTQVTTLQLNPNVAIDLGPYEEIMGIEILGASEHADLDRLTPTVFLENIQPA